MENAQDCKHYQEGRQILLLAVQRRPDPSGSVQRRTDPSSFFDESVRRRTDKAGRTPDGRRTDKIGRTDVRAAPDGRRTDAARTLYLCRTDNLLKFANLII